MPLDGVTLHSATGVGVPLAYRDFSKVFSPKAKARLRQCKPWAGRLGSKVQAQLVGVGAHASAPNPLAAHCIPGSIITWRCAKVRQGRDEDGLPEGEAPYKNI